MRSRRPVFIVSFALAGAAVLGAAWRTDRVAEARSAAPMARAALDTTLLKNYRWRAIGPDRGGRSIAVSGVRGRPNEAYFGAVGGGLWKTSDSGVTWNPITDGKVNSASVGAVAVSETNPDIVWIGMGETCIRGNIMAGDGVYKSTDGGKTWTHIGFASSENISKIRIDPRNPDVVYVAAFGNMSVPNPDRGVYRTTDGGKTWKKVLFRDDKTAAIDISVDRTNPSVIYAAMWEAFRTEYTMSSGGPGSGLFKSTDGGDTWTELTRAPGFPQTGLVGRIGVSVSGANPNRVYALYEHENGGLYRSDDAGKTWALINDNRDIRQRAFYYTHVTADPRNADMVYMQNTSLFRSSDGGKTLQNIGGSHGDKHDLWIDPDNPQHIVEANDGGGTVTFNNGQAWSDEDFPTAQFYHVITTAHVPYHVCGSQQDNSTACVPSDWNKAGAGGRGGFGGGGGRGARGGGAPGGAPQNDAQQAAGSSALMYQAGGGEPGYIAADPLDPDQFYSGTNNGSYINKFNRRTGYSREVNPYPWFYSGESSAEVPERWQWTFPIIFSKANPKLLFTSSQRLWKTTDGGRSWTAISGDLTRHDPKTMGHSGGPITGDMNGPEMYAVIFSVGPGKKNVNIIWTGSDDGLVHVTRDGGKTWANVTPKDLPDFARVSQVDASSFDDGTAYFSARRPLMGDKAPYLYRTHDYGKTWTKIVNGIRADDYMHAIREDPTRKGLLYAAGQHGVYISYNDGDTWESLRLNMPDVPVSDLVVEENDLVIATHGRSFWVLDDIAPLRQYNSDVAAAGSWLFAPPAAMRSATGAGFTYWLKNPASRVTIDVLDSANNVVRSFGPPDPAQGGGRGGRGGGRGGFNPSTTNIVGLNRLNWDLRYSPATSFANMILWGASVTGPIAPPGTYKVRLTADNYTQTQSFKVVRNPAYPDVTDADLRAQFNLAMQIRDKVSEANQAVIDSRRVKTDAADRMSKNSDTKLKESGDRLTTNLNAVEGDIYQVKNQSGQDPLNFPIRINNRLANLMSMVNRGDGAPLANWPSLFAEYNKILKVQTDRMAKVYASDLTAFNAELRRLGLPPVAPPCPAGQNCTVVP
ncbi:MAG: glycosyl hydrolase [Gemmatimonadaceae bacterium]|nr:glycosyl hydrolase [Gemmatimonadaceae bacterium]